MLKKIISGGQTGVDIAALRAAKSLGIATGGFMPKGFKTEDMDCPNHPEYAAEFGIEELPWPSYPILTTRNVKEADATLFIGGQSRGFLATRNAAIAARKPFMHIWSGDVLDYTERDVALKDVCDWFRSLPSSHSNVLPAACLNVAGNRDVHLEEPVGKWLAELFRALTEKSIGTE